MALDTFNPYLFVSAGEQSNKFLTPTYADGIARFQAQRAQELTGLTVQFGPIQEGTGAPALDNIRQISGRTGLKVMTAGKNLIDDSKKVGNSTLTAITIGQTAGYGTPSIFLKAGKYTFSVEFAEGVSGAGYVKVGSASGVRIWQAGETQGTITLTDDAMCSFYVYNSETPFTAVSDIIHAQVEAGESASNYTPYTGATYPITWETEAGTVYGGTLDVVSGVLTVDWDYIASYDGETLPGEWISDRDVYAEGTTPTTGAEVAYKLAEPVTYQLDPEQIMTLAGFNQIYSDAGPVIDIQF